MIRTIAVSQLKPGMYVAGIISEQRIPEAISQGMVHDYGVIEKLKGFEDLRLLIDTLKGLDVQEDEALRALAATQQAPTPQPVDFAEEMKFAQKAHQKALSLVDSVFSGVKKGQSINVGGVEKTVAALMGSVFRNQSALLCLGLIRQKDSYLMEHSVNLCVLLGVFGKHMGLDPDHIQHMAIGAMLHDIGKTKVPDHILHKPEKLTEEEFAVMKKHPLDSRLILEKTPGISELAIETAAHHHEKIDGSGYPYGLSKDEISLHGRMLAIVDVYDAITADRCYHRRLTPTEAMRRLLQSTATHLDESLTHQFIKSVGVYPVGTLVCMESGKMGVVMDSKLENRLTPLVRIFYHYKNRQYLPIEDIDLSKKQGVDRIVKTENPRNFNIDVHRLFSMSFA